MNNTKVEEKLAKAASLLKEAAKQFDQVGLDLTFEITIKAHLFLKLIFLLIIKRSTRVAF